MKTPHAKPKPPRYFEQIPVEVAKKIAKRQESTKAPAGPANVIVEPISRKTEPYSICALSLARTRRSSDWRSYDDRPFTLREPDFQI